MPQAYNNDHTVTPADLKTVPFDARFPYANQTKNCWQNYVDFRTPISLMLCVWLTLLQTSARRRRSVRDLIFKAHGE